MRIPYNIFTSLIASLLISFQLTACGSGGSSDTVTPVFPESVAGNWFICEFDDAIDCSILDDDGITLTSDDRILRIEESSQGSLEQCAGPCFSSSIASVQAAQTPIGTYSYSDGQLSVSINNCTETSTLLVSNAEAFIQISNCDDDFDGSSTANGSLLRKFAGTVDIVND